MNGRVSEGDYDTIFKCISSQELAFISCKKEAHGIADSAQILHWYGASEIHLNDMSPGFLQGKVYANY